VLITGESGTGKDLVARAIHVGSPRSARMFLPYNCTTTQRDLADSQLFGHRRGSFTGAITDQQGLIRTARAARCSSTKSAIFRWTSNQAASLPRAGRSDARRRDPAAGC
jgi:hypothetical protein